MKSLQKRILPALAAVLLAGVAAYWYWSPYLAMRELRDAAVAADAGRFNERVDFPKVRESLKSQFAARLHQDSADAGNNFGKLLAGVLIDKLIDTAVRPEAIMFAMREGKFKIESGGGTSEGGQDTGERRKTVWRTERQGVDTILFRGEREGSGARKDTMALVMQRRGFADWKLTAIRLPD